VRSARREVHHGRHRLAGGSVALFEDRLTLCPFIVGEVATSKPAPCGFRSSRGADRARRRVRPVQDQLALRLEFCCSAARSPGRVRWRHSCTLPPARLKGRSSPMRRRRTDRSPRRARCRSGPPGKTGPTRRGPLDGPVGPCGIRMRPGNPPQDEDGCAGRADRDQGRRAPASPGVRVDGHGSLGKAERAFMRFDARRRRSTAGRSRGCPSTTWGATACTASRPAAARSRDGRDPGVRSTSRRVVVGGAALSGVELRTRRPRDAGPHVDRARARAARARGDPRCLPVVTLATLGTTVTLATLGTTVTLATLGITVTLATLGTTVP
jgi:hypothetical protein